VSPPLLPFCATLYISTTPTPPQSTQCKASYDLTIPYQRYRCPLLAQIGSLPYERANVILRTRLGNRWNPTERFPSLAHLWSEWYNEYLDADFPRLIIRYEDTLLHAEQVTRAVLECAGQVTAEERFYYLLTPSKKHGKPVDFVAALFKNTRIEGRRSVLTDEDLLYAREYLSTKVMEAFRYAYIQNEEKE
jgi:hypothetical protein